VLNIKKKPRVVAPKHKGTQLKVVAWWIKEVIIKTFEERPPQSVGTTQPPDPKREQKTYSAE